jgi:uncharacterized protein (DUF1501 family)
VPYGDSLYYEHRPRVHLTPEQVLKIDDRHGFNPSLAPIKALYDEGKVAVLNGVGYPEPDYSHFRSMDIWYTAEPEKMATDGWLGKTVRELDPKADNVLTAVNFGRGLPRALSLAGVPVASVAELDNYGLLTSLSSLSERRSAIEAFSCMYDDGWNDAGHVPYRPFQPNEMMAPVMSYMGQTGLDARKGADILNSAVGSYTSTIEYPKTSIGGSLKSIAQVKIAGLGTRIFYAAHGSFDTHSDQLKIHGKLWRDISEAVGAFFADLRAHDEADDVVMFIWSEFGRRVLDNGSGTDHGAGGVAFLIGDPVKGGMYGEYPSLKESDLTIGNLKYTVDFRSTYASILEQWLQVDSHPIVGGSFEQFSVV